MAIAEWKLLKKLKQKFGGTSKSREWKATFLAVILTMLAAGTIGWIEQRLLLSKSGRAAADALVARSQGTGGKLSTTGRIAMAVLLGPAWFLYRVAAKVAGAKRPG